MNPRVSLVSTEVLSDNWYVLKKHVFDYQRRDGATQRLSREVYDRGSGAVVLLYNRAQRTVVLTRQFRLPTYLNGNADGMLVEACAGMLDADDPLTCVRRETEEETGYRVHGVRKVFQAYMSPGAVTEMLHFFVGEYFPDDKVSDGGGHAHEGEDIEVLELPLQDALDQVASGAICDAKTIMLLQYAQLHRLFG